MLLPIAQAHPRPCNPRITHRQTAGDLVQQAALTLPGHAHWFLSSSHWVPAGLAPGCCSPPIGSSSGPTSWRCGQWDLVPGELSGKLLDRCYSPVRWRSGRSTEGRRRPYHPRTDPGRSFLQDTLSQVGEGEISQEHSRVSENHPSWSQRRGHQSRLLPGSKEMPWTRVLQTCWAGLLQEAQVLRQRHHTSQHPNMDAMPLIQGRYPKLKP